MYDLRELNIKKKLPACEAETKMNLFWMTCPVVKWEIYLKLLSTKYRTKSLNSLQNYITLKWIFIKIPPCNKISSQL